MFKWLVIILGTFPIWLGLGWAIWETYILPRRTPQSEIDRLADELLAGKFNAEFIALTNQDRARFHGDGLEEVKWRRVHQALLRRRLQAESKPE